MSDSFILIKVTLTQLGTIGLPRHALSYSTLIGLFKNLLCFQKKAHISLTESFHYFISRKRTFTMHVIKLLFWFIILADASNPRISRYMLARCPLHLGVTVTVCLFKVLKSPSLPNSYLIYSGAPCIWVRILFTRLVDYLPSHIQRALVE